MYVIINKFASFKIVSELCSLWERGGKWLYMVSRVKLIRDGQRGHKDEARTHTCGVCVSLTACSIPLLFAGIQTTCLFM